MVISYCHNLLSYVVLVNKWTVFITEEEIVDRVNELFGREFYIADLYWNIEIDVLYSLWIKFYFRVYSFWLRVLCYS